MTAPSAPDSPAPIPRKSGWFFLRKFLRSPGSVASFWPSSRHLAAAMLRDLAPGTGVVEFGAGTGAFTKAIDDRLRPGSDYLGIDRDEEFVGILRQTYPHLEFAVADVFDLPELMAARQRLRPTAVICGLPLVAMDKEKVDRLLGQVRDLLPEDGVFRTFSYVHTMLNPNSWSLRRRMRSTFPEFTVRGPVVRNLPPALVFEGRVR